MKPSKKYRNAIDFARLCIQQNIEPLIMAELATLADRAFNAGVRECNIKDYDAGPHRTLFEAAAELQGLEVYWNGLFPTCTRLGEEVRIAANM